ncbi:MAG: DegT/DnrJ/EryC1/StrS family aminotransferase [Acidobacteria bacterium]|nr:DegT/DnrJ/EryC1/StrS family aminotransferase [Acidobacteriota bacterium]
MDLALLGGTPVRSEPFPTWPQHNKSEEEALIAVVRNGSWGGYSKKVKEFETAFAAFHHVPYGISCVNGTVALEVALRSLGIRCGDEVIVPAITFIATASSVLLCHGVPVFVDIDPATLNMSPEAVRAAITPRTKAIIPVHFGGQPADMDALVEIAKSRGLAIVEDASHAHGALWRGTPVGNFGDIATFSFQAFKLITSGEGGIVLTRSETLADKCRAYCNHGRSVSGGWFEHFTLGTNYRMTGFQAAVLSEQLARLQTQTQIRQANVARLRKQLASIEGLRLDAEDPRVTSQPNYLLTLRYDPSAFNGLNRDGFLSALQAEGIPAKATYPYPLYRNPLFYRKNLPPCSCDKWEATQDYESLYLPECERVCHDGIWLEQNLFLGTSKDVDDIIEACGKVQAMSQNLLAVQQHIKAKEGH